MKWSSWSIWQWTARPLFLAHTYHWHLVNLCCSRLCFAGCWQIAVCHVWSLSASPKSSSLARARAERSLFFFCLIPFLMSISSQDGSNRGNGCRLGKHAAWSLLHSFTVHRLSFQANPSVEEGQKSELQKDPFLMGHSPFEVPSKQMEIV